ncbi:MAG: hypothetical protein ACQCN6_01805 [Candidatus Bathyarchaeia archaeon]
MTLKPKEIYIRTIRLKHEKLKQLLAEAEAIMKREGWGFDEYLANSMLEYNLRHGAGNNSFPLDKFGVTWTKAESTGKCCFTGCRELSVGVALYVPKNQTVGVCKGHGEVVRQSINSGSRLWADLKLPKEASK